MLIWCFFGVLADGETAGHGEVHIDGGYSYLWHMGGPIEGGEGVQGGRARNGVMLV